MRETFLKIKEISQKESHTGYGDYSVFGGFSNFCGELLEGEEDDDARMLLGVTARYSCSNLKTRKAIIGLVQKLLSDMEESESVSVKKEKNPKTASAEESRSAENKSLPVQNCMDDNPALYAADSLKTVKGVGPKKAELLNKLGIFTVADLLEYYPVRHEDRRAIAEIASLADGSKVMISGYVDSVEVNRVRGNLQIVKARVTDGSGFITVIWFNQPWLKQQLESSGEVTAYGRVEVRGGRRALYAAEYELRHRDCGPGILPVYGLTSGINQKTMRSIVASALDRSADGLGEFLPSFFRQRYNLADRGFAVVNYHNPRDYGALEQSRRRLVFEEFFLFRLALSLQNSGKKRRGISMKSGSEKDFFSLLPFDPTFAQRRSVEEIYRDMASDNMMNRLLEGDVGSGKTVVAAAAVFRSWSNGHQSAVMAPTEILAVQHFHSLTKLFEKTGMRIGLLTGSVKQAEKRKLLNDTAEGRIDLLVGTHALIEAGADFSDLALVVIDEQHRFGVNQRNALFMKGLSPDMLVMTATPIPRTLAMTVFSGLDISVLDELPPGRKPVRTLVITDEQEDRAISFLRKHAGAGHQCYVVCPLVDESEKSDAEAVSRLYEGWRRKELKGISLGLVHGRMKGKEKEEILERFRSGGISVLIATTVIEVGVDVPNASVMFIKNADRFGLAQLHQIRGRIGRGTSGGTCLLQSSLKNELTEKRLKVLEQYTDGFKIAEEDLKLRGPGDFFGVRQHGLPEMKLADLFRDHDLLTEAAAAADEVTASDSSLSEDCWKGVKKRIAGKYSVRDLR